MKAFFCFAIVALVFCSVLKPAVAQTASAIVALDACNEAEAEFYVALEHTHEWGSITALHEYFVALEGRQICSNSYWLGIGDFRLMEGNQAYFGGDDSFKSWAVSAIAWVYGPTGADFLHQTAVDDWNGQNPNWPAIEANLITAKIRYNAAITDLGKALTRAATARNKWLAAQLAYANGYDPGGAGPSAPVPFTLPIFPPPPALGNDEAWQDAREWLLWVPVLEESGGAGAP